MLASIVASITVLWSVLPLFRHEAWCIRVFDFPRIQVTVITLLVLVAYIAVSGWDDVEDGLFIVALSLCAALQLKRIARYTPFFPRQLKSAAAPAADATLSVLVSNVYTPNREADALIRVIRRHDPDIVLAVETDAWWECALDVLATDDPFALRHPRSRFRLRRETSTRRATSSPRR